MIRGWHSFRAGLLGCGHADYVIVLIQVDAPDAVSGAAHGSDMAFVKADGHAFMGGEEDDLIAVGDAGGDQFVAVFNGDGIDAVDRMA